MGYRLGSRASERRVTELSTYFYGARWHLNGWVDLGCLGTRRIKGRKQYLKKKKKRHCLGLGRTRLGLVLLVFHAWAGTGWL